MALKSFPRREFHLVPRASERALHSSLAPGTRAQASNTWGGVAFAQPARRDWTSSDVCCLPTEALAGSGSALASGKHGASSSSLASFLTRIQSQIFLQFLSLVKNKQVPAEVAAEPAQGKLDCWRTPLLWQQGLKHREGFRELRTGPTHSITALRVEKGFPF